MTKRICKGVSKVTVTPGKAVEVEAMGKRIGVTKNSSDTARVYIEFDKNLKYTVTLLEQISKVKQNLSADCVFHVRRQDEESYIITVDITKSELKVLHNMPDISLVKIMDETGLHTGIESRNF